MARRNIKKPVYILVAGPQASGKTAALRLISENFPNVKIHNESGAEVIKERGLLGGAFVSEEAEREIMEREVHKLHAISLSPGVHVDETGIFSIAHARSLGYKSLAKEFLPKFKEALKKLDFRLLFLNTDPEISFARREKYYRKRGLSEDQLIACRVKIEKTYDEFLRLYESLACEKVKAENDFTDLFEFEHVILKKFNQLKNAS